MTLQQIPTSSPVRLRLPALRSTSLPNPWNLHKPRSARYYSDDFSPQNPELSCLSISFTPSPTDRRPACAPLAGRELDPKLQSLAPHCPADPHHRPPSQNSKTLKLQMAAAAKSPAAVPAPMAHPSGRETHGPVVRAVRAALLALYFLAAAIAYAPRYPDARCFRGR
jgi:hypothetical protein